MRKEEQRSQKILPQRRQCLILLSDMIYGEAEKTYVLQHAESVEAKTEFRK